MNRILKVLRNAVWLPAVCSTVGASLYASMAVAERDDKVIATLHAEGAQIYECKLDPKSPSDRHALIWQFREPVASPFVDGKTIGRHYAGPNWDHIDGSGVNAKVTASTPGTGPGDIAWLDLEVVGRRGNGILSDAATVQRVNTRGGMASGSCEVAGSFLDVPYSADYVFRRKS